MTVASLIAISLAQPFKSTPFKYLETPAGKKPRVVITGG